MGGLGYIQKEHLALWTWSSMQQSLQPNWEVLDPLVTNGSEPPLPNPYLQKRTVLHATRECTAALRSVSRGSRFRAVHAPLCSSVR